VGGGLAWKACPMAMQACGGGETYFGGSQQILKNLAKIELKSFIFNFYQLQ
jgi:hypothetical protein